MVRVSWLLRGDGAITSSSALQAYEIALMWAEDVQFLWGRTRSLSTLLYILNRLTAVAFAVCGGVDFRATTVDVRISHAIVPCGEIDNLSADVRWLVIPAALVSYQSHAVV